MAYLRCFQSKATLQIDKTVKITGLLVKFNVCKAVQFPVLIVEPVTGINSLDIYCTDWLKHDTVFNVRTIFEKFIFFVFSLLNANGYVNLDDNLEIFSWGISDINEQLIQREQFNSSHKIELEISELLKNQ